MQIMNLSPRNSYWLLPDQKTKRIEQAIVLVETIMKEARTADACAKGLLDRGCLAENVGNFHKAALFYQLGIDQQPEDSGVRYWLLNNLGFSLNQLGRYQE